MKMPPVASPVTFSRPLAGQSRSLTDQSKRKPFADFFLSAVTGAESRKRLPPIARAVAALVAPQPKSFSAPPAARTLSPVEDTKIPENAGIPPVSATVGKDGAPQATTAPAPVTRLEVPVAPTNAESPAADPTALPTEMFPLQGPRTVPPGYVPALTASLSINSETGAAEVRFRPTTSISEEVWLFTLDGAPLPSMLEQIRRNAEKLGISLADTPLTTATTDLPPPFAGKSLEELSHLVLPASYYYSDPNSQYGSIGGATPFTAEERAVAFTHVENWVIDLGAA